MDLYQANPQLVQHRLVTQASRWKGLWPAKRDYKPTPGAIHHKDFFEVAKSMGMEDVIHHIGQRPPASPERTLELEKRLGTWTDEDMAKNKKHWADPRLAAASNRLSWQRLQPLEERKRAHDEKRNQEDRDQHDKDERRERRAREKYEQGDPTWNRLSPPENDQQLNHGSSSNSYAVGLEHLGVQHQRLTCKSGSLQFS